MKIVHLATLAHGGAGTAAMRLHQGLLALGQDSSMLVLSGKPQLSRVFEVPVGHPKPGVSAWRAAWDRWQAMLRRYPGRPAGLELFSGLGADARLAEHPLLREAEVVNLHWVAGLVDIARMSDILAGKRLVWTLHDENAFTGGCHYAGACRGFRQACGACPQLGSSDAADLAARQWAAKREAYRELDLHVVCPSRWLAGEAKSSALFGRYDVSVTPYGLPLDIFRPLPRGPIREALGLEESDLVVLFGAEIHTERKGFRHLRRLLDLLPQRVGDRRVVAAAFGSLPEDLPDTAVPLLRLGFVSDPNVLAGLYGAADAYVLPTLEDNLPNTVLEAMACGCPTVGFAVGGVPDMVDHGVNGYLVPAGDVAGLNAGVVWAGGQGAAVREKNAARARERYGLDRQAEAYHDLYARLLGVPRPASPVRPGETFPESANAHRWLDGLSGLEIGPSSHNPFGLDTRNVGRRDPVYEEEQLRKTGVVTELHFEATADAVPVPEESEDFVLSSHVIEHCPDLVKTLLEWWRIIKPGGYLYMITPKRDAAPSDRGKPLTTWEHVLADFVARQTPDKEPEAGAFGHCHYHVFSLESMKSFIASIFGPRLTLVDELESDDKVGNGFTLVYRKDVSLAEAFPWAIPDGPGGFELFAARDADGFERLHFLAPVGKEQNCRAEPCLLGSVGRRGGCPMTRAIERARADNRGYNPSAMPPAVSVAVNLVPTRDVCWQRRQELCVASIDGLRRSRAGSVIEAVNLCHPDEAMRLEGWAMAPVLTRRANEVLGVAGKGKPFVDDLFDAACAFAESRGHGWFCYANSDVVFTSKLMDVFAEAAAGGCQALIVSRNEVTEVDAEGRMVPGYLEITGYDVFFVRVGWWRENRGLFQPYVVGERAWDDAYAAIMLSHADARLVWEDGALLHVKHDKPWKLEESPYSDHNLSLYAGPDRPYNARIQAFFDTVTTLPERPAGAALAAMIEDFFVRAPAPSGDPARFVNIVMVTYNRLEFTRQAVASVLKNTTHPYVLTVVDNASTDGSASYLKDLERKGLVKNLILLDENLGVAKAANLGWLAEPRAAYYLKLDNDIVIGRKGWLADMVATIDAVPELGAVAYNFEPRSYPLTTVRGKDIRLKHPGNLGGACILISRRTHERLGFWNEAFGLYGEEDADYGERIRCAGLYNAYMPDEDVGLHLPGGKAAVIDKATHAARDGAEEVQQAAYRDFKDGERRKNLAKREAFFARYRADPAALYVRTGFLGRRQPAAAAPAGKPRVLHCTVDETLHPCLSLRILGPNRALMEQGRIDWRIRAVDGSSASLAWDASGAPADVYTFQRGFPPELAQAVVGHARAHGAKVLFEIDDYLLELPDGHPEAEKYRAARPALEAVLRAADGVCVPTEALKAELLVYNRNVFVVPNTVDPALWPAASPRPAPVDGVLTMAVTGTASHALDVAVILPALTAVLKAYKGRLRLVFWGFLPEALRGVAGVGQEHAFTNDYATYARRLAAVPFDFALVPLADNRFNRAKSAIKQFEYAMAGLPAIYSDVGPYQTVRDGETGLKAANTPEAWVAAIRRLIEEPELRTGLATAARAEVVANHVLSCQTAALAAAYEKLLSAPKTAQAPRPLVSVVIPVWNQWLHTAACLRHLAAADDWPMELIVVDNRSTDETPEKLAVAAPLAVIVRNPENRGFVEACNQGASLARGAYVLLLNNDTMPRPGWLSALVRAAEADPKIGAVGAKLVYPDGTLQEAGGVVFADGRAQNFGRGLDPSHPAFNRPCEVDYCSGAVLLVRREAWQKLGGFDMRYAPGYYEETDLCFGLRKLGYTVRYEPAAEVTHCGSVSAGLDPDSGMRRHLALNRETFRAKWAAELAGQERWPGEDEVLVSADRALIGRRVVRVRADKNTPEVVDVAAANAIVPFAGASRMVCLVSDYLPRADEASSNLRVARIMGILAASGCRLSYLYFAESARDAAHAAAFPGMAVRRLPFALSAFTRALAAEPPDVLWLTNLWTPEYVDLAGQLCAWVRRELPQVRIVCDTMDFHAKKFRRRHAASGDPADLARAERFLALERRLYPLAQAVVVVSKEEAADIRAEVPDCPAPVVVPNIHRLAVDQPPWEPRAHFVFLGNYDVNHNIDAVSYFISDIWPRIRAAKPEAEFHILGAGAERLGSIDVPGVRVVGFVPELEAALARYRVFVCPLTYGAGLKGKIGSAAACGLPVVTTSVGAEGLGWRDGVECFIADAPARFAARAIQLHDDATVWTGCSMKAKQSMAERFSLRTASAGVAKALGPVPQRTESPQTAPAEAKEPAEAGSYANLAAHYRRKGQTAKAERYEALARSAAGEVPPEPAPEPAGAAPAPGTAASYRNLASHYRKKGQAAKAAHYERLAAQAGGAEPVATPEPARAAPARTGAAPQPSDGVDWSGVDGLTRSAFTLFNEDRFEEILGLARRHSGNRALASMATAELLARGALAADEPLLAALPEPERSLKRYTAGVLPRIDAKLDEEPRVHLILLSHNRAGYVAESLKQLAATDYRNYAVYIADNASTDGSWEILQQAVTVFPEHVPVTLTRFPTNIGRPAGHNWLLTGYDHAEAAFIAIGDDDLVSVPPEWLSRMINTARLFPKVAAVGGKAVNPGRPRVIHGGVRRIERFEPNLFKMSNEGQELDFGQFDYVDRVDHVIGCLHIYDRAALDDAGVFDIRFSPCQLVDIEHHLRLKLAGYEIVYNGLVCFEHLRAMGRKAGKDRALIGNSLGNIVKLLHLYEAERVQGYLAARDAARRAWLTSGTPG